MQLQGTLVVTAISFVMTVWYIRPLYNYMSIRKYVLLDKDNLSMKRRLQSGLPALLFYFLVLALLFYPAITNEVIGSIETGSILAIQVAIVFVLSRYDKRQTRYKVTETSVRFRKREISFKEKYKMKFKKSFWFILHKPRFILKSENFTIVVPLLSKNITNFIIKMEETNKEKGKLARDLYKNTRSYYIDNIQVTREINKKNVI